MITKKALGEFDSVTIFNSEYLLVERNGLFNLIGNDGHYVSRTWYKEIKKNNDGADFIEEKTSQKVQMRSIPLIRTYSQLRGALNNTSILSRIDTRCITILAPYKVYSATTSKYVTIVGKVDIFGVSYLLGKNGKLYENRYDKIVEYELPQFFLSLADMNSLIEVADKFNCIYSANYDNNNKATENTISDAERNSTACWIFAFDNSGNNLFMTLLKQVFCKETKKAWGGDTIKVRFNMKFIPEQCREKFEKQIETFGFKADYQKKQPEWRTRCYTLSELSYLYADMKVLSEKFNFIK